MTKYHQLFKQQVVNFYFEHHENFAFTLKHFNLVAKAVRCWIAQYKYSGTHRLAVLHCKRVYSPEFKHRVVQTILSSRFSMENTALYFGIASGGTLSQWLKAFRRNGINGLNPKPQGRPSMKPKYALPKTIALIMN